MVYFGARMRSLTRKAENCHCRRVGGHQAIVAAHTPMPRAPHREARDAGDGDRAMGRRTQRTTTRRRLAIHHCRRPRHTQIRRLRNSGNLRTGAETSLPERWGFEPSRIPSIRLTRLRRAAQIPAHGNRALGAAVRRKRMRQSPNIEAARRKRRTYDAVQKSARWRLVTAGSQKRVP